MFYKKSIKVITLLFTDEWFNFVYPDFVFLMNKGEINRMLIVATGSLHSPLTVQQKGTIPCIAHAVSIESGKGSD